MARSEAKRREATRSEAKRREAKRSEATRRDATRREAARSCPKLPEAARSCPKLPEAARSCPTRPDQTRADQSRPEPEAGGRRPEAGGRSWRSEVGGRRPSRNEPSRTEPSRTEPNRAESSREPRAESREPRAESREPRAESREPKRSEAMRAELRFQHPFPLHCGNHMCEAAKPPRLEESTVNNCESTLRLLFTTTLVGHALKMSEKTVLIPTNAPDADHGRMTRTIHLQCEKENPSERLAVGFVVASFLESRTKRGGGPIVTSPILGA